MKVAKAKKIVPYTKDDIKDLKAHSKAKTPAVKVSKLMKRSVGCCGQRRTRSASVLVTSAELLSGHA